MCATESRESRRRMRKRPCSLTSSKPAQRTIASQVRGAGRHQVDHGVSPRNSAAAERQPRESARVLLREDQPAAAEGGEPLEGEHRVAEVDQHGAAEDQVELASERLRRRLVDGHPHPPHVAGERLARDLEALAAAAVAGGAQTRRPVEVLDRVHVDGDDLGSAALELERPEALERADVQGAQAGEVGRDPVPLDVRAQVEHPLRDDPRPELLGVVPADLAEALAHRGQSYPYGFRAAPCRRR